MPSQKLLFAALFLAASVLTGFLTSQAGRPLKTAIFTLHKLTALAAIVFSFLYAFHQFKTHAHDLSLFLHVTLLIGMVILFVTGAILSFEKPFAALVLKIHQIFPLVTIALAVFLFLKQR